MNRNSKKGKYTLYTTCNGLLVTTCEVDSFSEAVVAIIQQYQQEDVEDIKEVYCDSMTKINILVIYNDKGDTLTTMYTLVENR